MPWDNYLSNLHVAAPRGPDYLFAGGAGWGNSGGMDFAQLDDGENTTPGHVLQQQLLQLMALKNAGHGGAVGGAGKPIDWDKQMLDMRAKDASLADQIAKGYGIEQPGHIAESWNTDPAHPNQFYHPGGKKIVDGQIMEIPGGWVGMDPVTHNSFMNSFARGYGGLPDARNMQYVQQLHKQRAAQEFQQLHDQRSAAMGSGGNAPAQRSTMTGTSDWGGRMEALGQMGRGVTDFLDNPFRSAAPAAQPMVPAASAPAAQQFDPGRIDSLLQMLQNQGALRPLQATGTRTY